MRSALPRLHLVSDDAVAARGDFVTLAAALMRLAGGRLALHLRAPRASGRRLWELARVLRDAARESGSLLLVNDRVDVALAVDADGVQCGARSLDPATARRLVGEGVWLGASVHDAAAAARAAAAGADFLLAGTLFATDSHPGRPGAGTDWLGTVATLGLPVIGIGGVSVERVGEVLGAGAAGVAVLGGIWAAARPETALRDYMNALYER